MRAADGLPVELVYAGFSLGRHVDRDASVLQVLAVHQDVPFDRDTTAAVQAELEALARGLGFDRARAE